MEIWKDIEGYEGHYQVSSLGRLKSLKKIEEKILKPIASSDNYLRIWLFKNGKRETKMVHQLVAIAFLNHKPSGMVLVIDHINDIRTDNRVDNLQIVPNRFNVCKTQGKYSSKYKGVYWVEKVKKWRSTIVIDKKVKQLGYFINEEEASKAYQKAVQELPPTPH
jgi:hypothetical protein